MSKKGKRAIAMFGPLLLVTNLALAEPTYQFDIRGASLQVRVAPVRGSDGLCRFPTSPRSPRAPARRALAGTMTAEQALQTLVECQRPHLRAHRPGHSGDLSERARARR